MAMNVFKKRTMPINNAACLLPKTKSKMTTKKTTAFTRMKAVAIRFTCLSKAMNVYKTTDEPFRKRRKGQVIGYNQNIYIVELFNC